MEAMRNITDVAFTDAKTSNINYKILLLLKVLALHILIFRQIFAGGINPHDSGWY